MADRGKKYCKPTSKQLFLPLSAIYIIINNPLHNKLFIMIITIDTEKKEVYLTETITLQELANFKIESLSDFTIVPKIEKNTIIEKCDNCIFDKSKTVFRDRRRPFDTYRGPFDTENPYDIKTLPSITPPKITCEKTTDIK